MIMVKKAIYMVGIFALMLSVSGCWDANDINEASILTTVLLDKQDGEYVFYVEVANTEASGGTEGQSTQAEKFVIVKASGKTLAEAREGLNRQMRYPIYLSAVRALVLTRNVVKEDITTYLNRLRSNNDYRKKVILVTTNEKPEELFEVFKKRESVGFYIEQILEQLVAANQLTRRTTGRYIEIMISSYSSFIIPNIRINGEAFEIDGFSVVLRNKLVGFVPNAEWNGIIFLNAKRPEINYVIPSDEVEYTILVTLKKRKVEPYYKNGQVSIKIRFVFDAEIEYSNGNDPSRLAEKDKKPVAEKLKKALERDIKSALETSQKEMKSDYFDFNNAFYMKYLRQYRELSWYEAYPKAKLEVETKIRIDELEIFDYGTHEIE